MAVEAAVAGAAIESSRRGRFPAGALLGEALGTTRGRVGAVLVVGVVLVAVLGPVVAPHSPTALPNDAVTFASPSHRYPLGTDFLSRDVLSRVLNGGWELLLAALAATILGVALGTVIGVVSAFERGWVETVLLRAMGRGATPEAAFQEVTRYSLQELRQAWGEALVSRYLQ